MTSRTIGPSDLRRAAEPLPDWVPEEARHYLAHTEQGMSLRALARDAGLHPSTVMRRVRRLEGLRDDPLVDGALRRLGRRGGVRGQRDSQEKETSVIKRDAPSALPDTEDALAGSASRVLRRLCESGAILAVAPDMDTAVVVRDTGPGAGTRTATVAAATAQAMALKGWIAAVENSGRVARYRITASGRAALGLAETESSSGINAGLAEAQARFAPAAAAETPFDVPPNAPPRRGRFTHGETPLLALARRRDKHGRPFLSPALVGAGERLREDFELAELGEGPRIDWSGLLRDSPAAQTPAAVQDWGPEAARARLAEALCELGPGLGDMVLMCCCHLEGLETAERSLGWSARSGKIVLRIALQRLRRHYDARGAAARGMIG